jgi:hypothetical protein
MPLVSRSEY